MQCWLFIFVIFAWQLISQNDQKKLVTWMHLRETIKNGRFDQ